MIIRIFGGTARECSVSDHKDRTVKKKLEMKIVRDGECALHIVALLEIETDF